MNFRTKSFACRGCSSASSSCDSAPRHGRRRVRSTESTNSPAATAQWYPPAAAISSSVPPSWRRRWSAGSHRSSLARSSETRRTVLICHQICSGSPTPLSWNPHHRDEPPPTTRLPAPISRDTPRTRRARRLTEHFAPSSDKPVSNDVLVLEAAPATTSPLKNDQRRLPRNHFCTPDDASNVSARERGAQDAVGSRASTRSIRSARRAESPLCFSGSAKTVFRSAQRLAFSCEAPKERSD